MHFNKVLKVSNGVHKMLSSSRYIGVTGAWWSWGIEKGRREEVSVKQMGSFPLTFPICSETAFN